MRLFLNDYHCRQVLLGCSHDNGYARMLEDYQDDPASRSRVCLLEGVPFPRELESLRHLFLSAKFDSLFRARKIQVEQHQHQQQMLSQPTPPIARTISNSNGESFSVSACPVPQTWASTATMLPTRMASPPATPKPSQSTPQGIPRNRYGQRVDPEPKGDRYDARRVKTLKMCNVHFLRGDCGFGGDCTHSHTYKPSAGELATLRYVVRLSPCRMGADCDDPKCMYGHHCPAGNPCFLGENCRFPEEQHNIDTRVVGRIKV